MARASGDEGSAWTHGPSNGIWGTPPLPASSGHSAYGRPLVPPLPNCTRCATETFRTFLLPDIDERAQIACPEDAAGLLVPELLGRDRERCVAALLDTKHRLVNLATVSVGSVDQTFMSPREVLRDALLANATALVLAHNHPSGDPQPSRDDELVTARLVEAGEIVGVKVLDHLVVGGSHWVSLARCGVV